MIDHRSPGDTPRKIGWGCAAHFPVNYRKHNLCMAFVDFLFNNEASRLKNIPISGLELKNYTLFMTKMAKISENRYPIYDQNG